MSKQEETKTKSKNRGIKIAVVAVIAILVILVGVDLYGGNFLAEYAVGRSGDGGNRNVALEVSGPTTDLEKRIEANKAAQKERTEAFVEAVEEKEVEITSGDNLQLKGYLYEQEAENHLFAIVIHGYRSSHKSMINYAERYFAEGYTVLTPDLRACGDSEGNYVGMGWLDRKDILSWIDWIVAKDAQAKIVIHGVSMGGATTMMVAGEKTPDNVVAFVEDCGYTSVWDIFSSELKLRFHLPAFPLLYTASGFCNVKAGYTFGEAASVKQIQQSEKPVMFIHGDEDDFVPFYMLQILYDAKTTGDKEMLRVEGAGHGKSSETLGDAYWEKVFAFVSKYNAE